MPPLLKKPSAWLPIAMSLAVLAMMFFFFISMPGGPVREEDEGVGAHLFQLLMGGQLPIVLYFLIRWTPENPKQVGLILLLHILLILAACFPVFYFNL